MKRRADKNGYRLPWPSSGNSDDPRLRFEECVDIRLTCCDERMRLLGNMSLREGGGPNTTLAYACDKCFRRVTVCDEVPTPSGQALDDIDATE